MEQNKMLEMEQFLAYQFMNQNDQRKRAYICSPLSAKTDEGFVENMHRARAYMHYAAKEMGLAARAPMRIFRCCYVTAYQMRGHWHSSSGFACWKKVTSSWYVGTGSVWGCRGKSFMPYPLKQKS